MNFNQIKTIAIQSVLDPDLEGFQRHICRWYSKEFSTPLTEVEQLNPDYVLLHFLEAKYEQMPEDELLEIAYPIADPEGYQKEQESLEELIKELESKNVKKTQSFNSTSPEVKKYEAEDEPDMAGDGLETLTHPDQGDL